MMDMIRLEDVVYDPRARDGTWCANTSKDYPNGCPNFKGFPGLKGYCKKNGQSLDFLELERQKGPFDWYAVVEEFDIETFERDHLKSGMSRKMARNPRWWQKGVENRLRDKALRKVNHIMGDVLLKIPEAHGVDVVRTMSKVGVTFEWGLQAKMIRKVMLIGKRK
jgi:hypothetical protein